MAFSIVSACRKSNGKSPVSRGIFDLDQSLEQTVKQARGRSLEPGFPLSDLTLAVHHSGSFVHPADPAPARP
jgi:hypothetical protein